MKLLHSLPLLALLAGACQQQSPTGAIAAAKATTVVATAEAKATPQAVAVSTSSPKLTPDMLAFLKDNDLSPLWRTLAKREDDEYAVHNGFFGVDNYRIEFVFTSITRDATDPALFLVTGKNRYKETITPFVGSIRITQLLDHTSVLLKDSMCIALGSFEFSEQRDTDTDGVFRGTMALDFFRDDEGKLVLFPFAGAEYGARGSGYQFTGNWVSKSTHKTKPVMFAAYFEAIVERVLEDFNIGDRSGVVDPKYAKLGWENYWKNDEWWAEPGTVTARADDSKVL
jgi:hypothetical protein